MNPINPADTTRKTGEDTLPSTLEQVRGVIFDFDGTLYGNAKLWTRLIVETLAQFHVQVTQDQAQEKARDMIKDGIFYNISGVAIALAKDKGVEGQDLEVRQRFLENLDIVMDKTGPGENLLHLLQELRKARIQMGIVTFQRLPRLEKRLTTWKVKEYFRSIVTPDHIAEFKPSPLPFTRAIGELGLESPECLVVGDEPVDMIGAKKAGAAALGLPNGFFSKEELTRAGADSTITSLQDLEQILSLGHA